MGFEKLTGIKIYPATIYIYNEYSSYGIRNIGCSYIYIYMDSKYGMDDHPYYTMYIFVDPDTFGSVWMPAKAETVTA